MQLRHQSITDDIYLQLLQLKDKLSKFQTVSCRLMHEQVQELLDHSVTGDADLDQLTAKRKGFCNTTMRRISLGCAHTSANDSFAALADAVYETGISQTDSRPSAAINELVVKIYLIDHEKGIMEKRKAVAQHQQLVAEIPGIQEAINEIISRHQTVVDQLEKFRCDIIHQVDTAIENFKSTSQSSFI